jgi:hypothetical protein
MTEGHNPPVTAALIGEKHYGAYINYPSADPDAEGTNAALDALGHAGTTSSNPSAGSADGVRGNWDGLATQAVNNGTETPQAASARHLSALGVSKTGNETAPAPASATRQLSRAEAYLASLVGDPGADVAPAQSAPGVSEFVHNTAEQIVNRYLTTASRDLAAAAKHIPDTVEKARTANSITANVRDALPAAQRALTRINERLVTGGVFAIRDAVDDMTPLLELGGEYGQTHERLSEHQLDLAAETNRLQQEVGEGARPISQAITDLRDTAKTIRKDTLDSTYMESQINRTTATHTAVEQQCVHLSTVTDRFEHALEAAGLEAPTDVSTSLSLLSNRLRDYDGTPDSLHVLNEALKAVSDFVGSVEKGITHVEKTDESAAFTLEEVRTSLTDMLARPPFPQIKS